MVAFYAEDARIGRIAAPIKLGIHESQLSRLSENIHRVKVDLESLLNERIV